MSTGALQGGPNSQSAALNSPAPIAAAFLLHGTPAPPPERISLRVGPLTMFFEGGDLRYLKLGEREVIRRIYAAVRDRNWGTVPAEISDLKLDVSALAFRISYTSTHRQGDIHFVWQAEIHGGADGSVRFIFDGEAKSTFLRNRIGFCVLHPIRECAGARCRAFYTNGTEAELAFPDTIAAEQPVNGLHDLAGLAHEIEPGRWTELRFAGDVFETEDQRNWIDASFKTFCTPLHLPRPVEIQAGTRVRQEVRLTIVERACEGEGSGSSHDSMATVSAGRLSAPTHQSLVVVRRLETGVSRLPALGLGIATHAQALHESEIRLLRALKPAHLRADLRLWENDWADQFQRATREATALGARIELALHLDSAPDHNLKPLAELLAATGCSLARVLVFQRGQKSTTPEALRTARKLFGQAFDGIPLGAGSNADLYQLNLQRPPADADFICWSMNPQVHAFDNASIAETPEAAAQQLASVGRYFPGKPLVVSPITFRPRFNPVATGPEPSVPPGELPPQVDPRQLSLFGAAWTLAMLKALAEAGAGSVTFYETIGWRGVMETARGPQLPEKFPSTPGAVFPLYHVLADVAEFANGEATHTASSDSLAVAPLFLRRDARRRLMLANLSHDSQTVRLQNFDGILLSRSLDASTSIHAMTKPESFRAQFTPVAGSELTLPPHAVVTLDFAQS